MFHSEILLKYKDLKNSNLYIILRKVTFIRFTPITSKLNGYTEVAACTDFHSFWVNINFNWYVKFGARISCTNEKVVVRGSRSVTSSFIDATWQWVGLGSKISVFFKKKKKKIVILVQRTEWRKLQKFSYFFKKNFSFTCPKN